MPQANGPDQMNSGAAAWKTPNDSFFGRMSLLGHSPDERCSAGERPILHWRPARALVRLSMGLSLVLVGLGLQTPRAEACGGLFCSLTPVNQAEEAIIFDVDQKNNTVTAIINIVYQGRAEDFAWVLPLQINPTDIRLGSTQAFSQIDRLTRPRFELSSFEQIGMCTEFARTFDEDASANSGGQGGGVQVLQEKEVGPYQTAVLQGSTIQELRTWLESRDYQVTDEMMDAVVPYVEKGDVLIALRLKNDSDVGEIAPLEVEMTADPAEKTIEACIPIRLTAIAANSDMPITTYVLTDEGRAIPQNFYHVIPNVLKIDWLAGGSNYRQLISDAIDEADAGHAFVTEYAGPADILKEQVYVEGQLNLDELRKENDLGAFLRSLSEASLLFRPQMRGILERNFPSVADCPSCPTSSFNGTDINPGSVIDEIEARILEPDRRAQALMDRRGYLTRLLTLLDPEEMTVDPMFAYSTELPDVSNVHQAKLISHCGAGGFPGSDGYTIVLADGRRIEYGPNGRRDAPIIDSMPSATRIEQLSAKQLVVDNDRAIDGMLDDHNDTTRSGCGCSNGSRSSLRFAFIPWLVMMGFWLWSRRRRSSVDSQL